MSFKKPNKVLINTIGPWLDKGESGILISMAAILREYYPNLEITVSSSTFKLTEIDKEQYSKYSLEVVPGIFNNFQELLIKIKKLNYRSVKIVIASLYLSILLISSLTWALIYRYLKIDLKLKNQKILKKYAESDWILVCGGQNIIHVNYFPLIPLFEILFSKILQKKIMLYSQSMGPFLHRYSKLLICWILNRTDLITTRESISKDTLIDMGVNVPVFVTADAAFTLPAISKQESISKLKDDCNLSETELNIAITAIPWDFPKEPNLKKKNEMYENYIDSLAKSADSLIERFNAHIIFFPQVIIPKLKNDIPVSIKIYNKIKNKSNVSILKKDYSPEELKGMYGCMDLLLGTRFHSCIFALSMGVPTLAIEYDGHKAYGIMKLLGLENFVIEIEKISYKSIQQKIQQLIRNKEDLKRKIISNVKILKNASEKNMLLTQKYLN
jgi:colanic acid/amylovoran biosynthesis protein